MTTTVRIETPDGVFAVTIPGDANDDTVSRIVLQLCDDYRIDRPDVLVVTRSR